jgi:ESS family glutamate:Na+ symporter
MIGGLIVQFFEQRFDKYKLIDLGLMRRIQNSSLDFLVVAAIANIRVEIIVISIVPLLILIAAGILWNVFCVSVLARRILPDAWFERSIAELGQSMGVTATGLLLLRVVDPEYKTPAADAFACKQIVHEPFMGGGLWTSTAIPLIAIIGAAKVLWISVAAMSLWVVLIFLLKMPTKVK